MKPYFAGNMANGSRRHPVPTASQRGSVWSGCSFDERKVTFLRPRGLHTLFSQWVCQTHLYRYELTDRIVFLTPCACDSRSDRSSILRLRVSANPSTISVCVNEWKRERGRFSESSSLIYKSFIDIIRPRKIEDNSQIARIVIFVFTAPFACIRLK